jgi:hypothetical protein
METPSRIEIGIELIRSKGSASGQEFAEALGCLKKNVQPSVVPTSPVCAPAQIAGPADEVRFLFGCDGRLQVHLGDQRIICTREETASVGRMMSALEPVWNV